MGSVKKTSSGSSDAEEDGKMDICQDESCPNYVIDEPNKCITFKQVSECPTPDYLNSNKEPVTEVPCSDRVMPDVDKDAEKARYEFGLWSNKHMIPSKTCTVDFGIECPTLVKLMKMEQA